MLSLQVGIRGGWRGGDMGRGWLVAVCVLCWSTWSAADASCRFDVEKVVPGATEANLVCINLEPSVQVIQTPPRNTLKPNEELIVVVRAATTKKLSIALSGSRGLVTPTLASEKEPPAAKAAACDCTITVARFGPRQPGHIDLSIRNADGTDAELAHVELEVEQRFWGAARFGVSAVFGNFYAYEARPFAGSQTAQIFRSYNPAQFEFVLGFAPYLEALHSGGRSYASNRWDWENNFHLAPFLGFGLLGQSATGLDALTSFHAGVELEFATNFSIALTVVVRRTRDLKGGYVVGSPVEVGAPIEAFTSPAISVGGGVVINASADFLRFAGSPK